eukprot:TRINITY_DN29623_c0_g1_i1.p1 TRINITY_DN29623_c0_g1~~TRINITY_DN29623_c0_g1_i1.p1  ORF type:complete len:241 (-),score=3.86 TRINITY_DN29623_c0_g1_i1:194-844(-)
MADCIFRNRPVAKWISFLDMDEYLEAKPPYTIGSFLRKHHDKAWISFGSMWWATKMCREAGAARENGTYISHMGYRWPGYYCQQEGHLQETKDPRVCLTHYGHRKNIVNPRKVWLMAVHRVLNPMEGGHDANAHTELIHNHFQGLTHRDVRTSSPLFCLKENVQAKDDWWVWDEFFRELVETRVVNCKVGNTSCVEKIYDDALTLPQQTRRTVEPL